MTKSQKNNNYYLLNNNIKQWKAENAHVRGWNDHFCFIGDTWYTPLSNDSNCSYSDSDSYSDWLINNFHANWNHYNIAFSHYGKNKIIFYGWLSVLYSTVGEGPGTKGDVNPRRQQHAEVWSMLTKASCRLFITPMMKRLVVRVTDTGWREHNSCQNNGSDWLLLMNS